MKKKEGGKKKGHYGYCRKRSCCVVELCKTRAVEGASPNLSTRALTRMLSGETHLSQGVLPCLPFLSGDFCAPHK